MKNYYKLPISLLLVFIALPMMGQSNLQKWVDKWEKVESVNVTIIKKRNPDTGKIIQDLKTISFEGNQSIYKELLDACQKDEEKAFEVIKNKKGKKDIPQIYRFRVGKIDYQYLFSISDSDDEGSVTIITRDISDSDKDSVMLEDMNFDEFGGDIQDFVLAMKGMKEEIDTMKDRFDSFSLN